MTAKIKTDREKFANPPVEVRLLAPLKICSGGWFPEFFAVCIFTSATTGTVFEILSPLKADSATEIVNWLFRYHKENGFIANTPSEHKRLSLLIANSLESQASQYQTKLKKYGYPLRFKTS